MTTDIKNNLWVCHYGGACISVYNLRAKKIHKISLPVKNITNCTFGGKNNKNTGDLAFKQQIHIFQQLMKTEKHIN